MSPLPYPVRIAAGLVVTALEQARDLPRHAVELPVTAVSQALQVSMRVQQKVTELAIKGDRALGTLRPADDVPSWATFDDELPDTGYSGRNGSTPVASLRPTVTEIPVERRSPASRSLIVPDEVAERAAAASDLAAAAPPEPGTSGTADTSGADATRPDALPEYPTMSIAQLRGKLRSLTVDDLSDLLAWETAHENRPAHVTMLTNRISTLSGQ